MRLTWLVSSANLYKIVHIAYVFKALPYTLTIIPCLCFIDMILTNKEIQNRPVQCGISPACYARGAFVKIERRYPLELAGYS